MQSADAEDPWLQLEWGATLLAVSGATRLSEAATHLEVAAALFGRVAQQQLAAAQGGGGAGAAPSEVTALDGRTPLSAAAALEAAASAMQALRDATAPPCGAQQQVASATYCGALQRLCHLRLQAAIISRGDGERGADAEAAGRACIGELEAAPGCEAQNAELRALVSGGSGRRRRGAARPDARA